MMRTVQTVVIGVIISIVLIGGYIYYENLTQNNVIGNQTFDIQKEQKHRDYCVNWSNQLDKEKEKLESLLDSGIDPIYYNTYNKEINSYNKECVY